MWRLALLQLSATEHLIVDESGKSTAEALCFK
jgi:hypothetical protein